MATKIIIDYRREDQNRLIYQPYWITSAEIDSADFAVDESECGLVFSFPAAKYGDSQIIIKECCFQVTELFAGGTITVDVGSYTIPLETTTTGGLMTIIDADDYVPTADITYATAANYWAASGDWLAIATANAEAFPSLIDPVDATVQAVGVYLTNDGASYTTGKGRVHMLVAEVPLAS